MTGVQFFVLFFTQPTQLNCKRWGWDSVLTVFKSLYVLCVIISQVRQFGLIEGGCMDSDWRKAVGLALHRRLNVHLLYNSKYPLSLGCISGGVRSNLYCSIRYSNALIALYGSLMYSTNHVSVQLYTSESFSPSLLESWGILEGKHWEFGEKPWASASFWFPIYPCSWSHSFKCE